MAKSTQGLGELELTVLKTIWQSDGCTVQEVAEIIARKRKCARTTILTVMQRLHAKGYLRRAKRNGVFRYYPTEAKGKVMGGLVKQFVDKVLDGSPTTLVSYLAESGVSDAELAEMRRVLDEAQNRKGEKA